nr:TetR/AcrR family transcriptional regulator [Aerococcus urinae]
MKRIEAIDEKPDGRRARGHENRRRIVEAMLHLIGEGSISPSAEDVATRAEVGLRTVFRHFDDMDGLYREISEMMMAELMPIAAAPLPDGDWQLRMTEMVERRARVFEKMMPFKVAADVHRHRSAYLRDVQVQLTTMQRQSLRHALPPDLRKSGPVFESLDLLFSFDSWRRLRQEQGLSVAQAKKVVLFAVAALVESGKA